MNQDEKWIRVAERSASSDKLCRNCNNAMHKCTCDSDVYWHQCKNCGYSIGIAKKGEFAGKYIHALTGNWLCALSAEPSTAKQEMEVLREMADEVASGRIKTIEEIANEIAACSHKPAPTEALEIARRVREHTKEAICAGVEIAIVRHDLANGDSEFDMSEIAKDAANAAFGEDSCDENPVPEVQPLLALAEAVESQQREIEKLKVRITQANKLQRMTEDNQVRALHNSDKYKEEVEQLTTQLAGCSVAALGWSIGEQSAKKGDWGWSPAYQDVLELRRKYESQAATIATLTKERDLAIAHDRQPYPTAEAYELVCKADRNKSAELTRLKGALAERDNAWEKVAKKHIGSSVLKVWCGTEYVVECSCGQITSKETSIESARDAFVRHLHDQLPASSPNNAYQNLGSATGRTSLGNLSWQQQTTVEEVNDTISAGQKMTTDEPTEEPAFGVHLREAVAVIRKIVR